MWCVAELNEEYIAKMEDVLALYEKPFKADEPVICMTMSVHAGRAGLVTLPGVTTNTSAVVPPTSSPLWNPRPGGTSTVPLPIVRRLSSPK